MKLLRTLALGLLIGSNATRTADAFPGAAADGDNSADKASDGASNDKSGGLIPDDAEIDRLIALLGSAVAQERDDATRKLEAVGLPALQRLRDIAETTPSAEVRRRAKSIAATIDKQRWQVRVFEGHEGVVWATAISRDGKLAFTGGGSKFTPPRRVPKANAGADEFVAVGWERGTDFAIRIWNLDTGKEIRRLEGHTDAVSSLSLTTDGQIVASGAYDNTIRLWDVASGKELKRFLGHTGGVDAVALRGDGRRLVSGARDGTLRVWDVQTGKERLKLLGGPERRGRGDLGFSSWVRAIALSPDGRRVAASGGLSIGIWDLDTGKEIRQLRGHGAAVLTLAFSPDGRCLISGGQEPRARIWDTETGKELLALQGDPSFVEAAAWSPDGKWVLTGSLDKTVRLWDADTGAQLRLYEGHAAPVGDVTFAPDGRHALSGGWDGTARLWLMPKDRPVAGGKD